MTDREPSTDRAVMGFGDHLEELRKRILLAIVVPLPLMVGLFAFASEIRYWLWVPAESALRAAGLPTTAQVLSPIEAISVDMKLSFIGALAIGAPWVLYQAWRFISPGLYANERRMVHFLLPLSSALVLVGIALLYWVILPIMLRALISFGDAAPTSLPRPEPAVAVSAAPGIPVLEHDPTSAAPGQMWIIGPTREVHIAVPSLDGTGTEVLNVPTARPGGLQQSFRLSEYVNLVLLLLLCIALAFQLPVVVLLLGWLGIVSPEFLRKHRKHALAIVTVVAAVVGPGDVLSMLLFLVPLYLLYELSILLLRLAPAHRVAAGTVLRRGAQATDDAPRETGREGDE